MRTGIPTNMVQSPLVRSLLLAVLAFLCTPSIAGFNVQGMWWGAPAGSESGWGLNITHQGSILFVTWFTYDTDGSGLWLVMPRTVESSPNTYEGRVYRTTGPAYDTAAWDANAVVASDVGSARFVFSDDGSGSFAYTVNDVSGLKAITRQVFATPAFCTTGGSPGIVPVYQDLWWADPAGSEPGWGVNVAHQGDIVFATWFTYAADGRGLWLVVPRATRVSGSDTFTGDLFRTTGPAFGAPSWNPDEVVATRLGQASFTFADNDHGTFTYVIGSLSRSKRVVRQVYASPATVCRPADARNGEYKLLGTDFTEYTLAIDFDRRRFAIRSADANVVSEGTIGDAVDGTYTFEMPGHSPARNNARFRTAANLIVGSHPLGGSEAVPFVAANRFVGSASEMPPTDLWMFSRDMDGAGLPVANSRIIAIRLDGNRITYCSVPSGALTRVANCSPANLATHALTFNADGSATWLDDGAVVKLYVARSANELVVLRAQSYPATSGNRRFQIALQDSKALAAGTYEGGVTSGSWGTASTVDSRFTRLATTSTGAADNIGGALVSAGSLAAPLRLAQGSDSVTYFVQGTGLLGAHVAARNSAKGGTLGFGLLR